MIQTGGSIVGNVITAESVGSAAAIVRNGDLSEYRYQITVYADAAALGDRFSIDKGMFQGKRTIVFGTSITDGALGDPNTFTGMNYTDTYFALLCNYLGVITDPTDLRNCNLACGGTTISYVGNNPYGISGVERIEATEPFSDGSRVRDPYPNILRADLCVIYYGGNDLVWNVLAESNGMDGLNDRPTRAEDAKTVKGALYYLKAESSSSAGLPDEPEDGKLRLVAANDLPEDKQIPYTVKRFPDDAVVLSGACSVPADAAEQVLALRIAESEKEFYHIEWTMDEKTYKNHCFTNIIDIDVGKT